MNNLLLPLAALLCLSFSVQAQKINGVLLQADGKAAEYATITLHQAADSSLVKGAITGASGEFEFSGIESGSYLLKGSQIGATDTWAPAFEYDGAELKLEPFRLADNTQEISEVTVVARRPAVEVKADKTILNVDGTVNSTGLNALELLRKAPGVTVDNNDNVNLKGKNNVRVMIDGREVPLDGKDLAALLKGTQAADINNIEIITNPSAKYDAAGNAGIINIKLKKNKALWPQTYQSLNQYSFLALAKSL